MVFYKGAEAFEELHLIDLSFEQLVEADCHIGSKLSRFEKLNFSYVFAKRFDIMFMNLAYGLYNLKLAVYFLSYISSRRGKILFFDSLDSTKSFVEFVGVTSKQYYVNRKWIAGLLTNFKNFYPAVFTGLSKHFRFGEYSFAGMQYIHRPPNTTCLLNIARGSAAFYENFRLGIPIISLVRSDDKISGVTFPIFANNNSLFSFFCFFSVLRAAVLNGYKEEIYKFYRKLLKKNLKIRYNKLINRLKISKSFIIYFKQYLIKFFIVTGNGNDVFSHQFFKFILSELKHSEILSKYVFQAFYDFFILFDKFVYPEIESVYMPYYSPVGIHSHFSSRDLKFDFASMNLLFLPKFFYKLIYIIFYYLFSNDLAKLLTFLFDRFYFLFNLLVTKFLKSNNEFFKNLDVIKSIKRFYLLLFLFRKWCSYNYTYSIRNKNQYLNFNYSRQFVYEFFPLFHYSKSLTPIEYSLNFFAKNSFFKFSQSSFSVFNFFTLNNLVKLRRYFIKMNSFKALIFSKPYKRSFRIFNKKVKFLRYLTKSIYKKNSNSIFFDNLENKFVFLAIKSSDKNIRSRYLTYFLAPNLSKRIRLKTLYKSTMLQYFDEEFDDFKFPVNNEFFFYQVAYGLSFLNRQYVRNKIIQGQKGSSRIANKKRRKLIFKLRNKVKLSRLLLFFYFFNKTKN